MPAAFKAQWKKVKTKYEAESGKSKPSQTFLGFRLPSGIEAALAKVDAAKSKADYDKAYKAYRTAMDNFGNLCVKTQNSDPTFRSNKKLKDAFANMWEGVKDMEEAMGNHRGTLA